MSLLALFFVFIIVFGLGAFYWFWWAAPVAEVPLHLDETQIRQLEVQNRLRQTNYQVLTGIGVAATLITTTVQLSITSSQWSTDHELRLRSELNREFGEAAKLLASTADVYYAGQAARQISRIATESPDVFGAYATDILSDVVRGKTDNVKLLPSINCAIDGRTSADMVEMRQEAAPAVQAAMRELGRPSLAKLRMHVFWRFCSWRVERLNFENVKLDNLDLSGADLSCSRMSQVSLQRTSLRGATLAGSDMRGAKFADWDVPGSPAKAGRLGGQPFQTNMISFQKEFPAEEVDRPPIYLEEWKTYRCFITDMREVNLRSANLSNASMGGADLRNADFTGANLCGAVISRANFKGAKGLTKTMLEETCVGSAGDSDDKIRQAQPVGLEEIMPEIPVCGSRKNTCE